MHAGKILRDDFFYGSVIFQIISAQVSWKEVCNLVIIIGKVERECSIDTLN